MKATLTIEVPDDFKKGDYINCDYAELPIDKCVYQCVVRGGTCNADNCPLEIQDVETTHCYLGSPCEYQNKDIRIDEEIDQ